MCTNTHALNSERVDAHCQKHGDILSLLVVDRMLHTDYWTARTALSVGVGITVRRVTRLLLRTRVFYVIFLLLRG